MCSGSKSKICSSSDLMESEIPTKKDVASSKSSLLLELAASDDLAAFRSEVEEKGFDLNEASFWYTRRIGSRKMGLEERTPLTVASTFGSVEVVKYIIQKPGVDVNRACGSDGVTALHCAVAGGACTSVEIVKLLLEASADASYVNASGSKPIDLIPAALNSVSNSRNKVIELLLKGDNFVGIGDYVLNQEAVPEKMIVSQLSEKKEYPVDVTLPDINNGVYGTDEFRMYTFKVKPCSRAYSHDWTECPFVHPGENARRRDPRKYPYSCVPCPEFRKGSCPKSDACEYAHGVFESWLHPAQYRTRLCKDEVGCNRKVCFFAHKPEELRPVYASTGSAMPSPRSAAVSAVDMTSLSPLMLGPSSLPMPTTSTPPMSPLAAASSPKSGGSWQNKVNLNLTPPALQLQGSRLKTAFSARDLDVEMELLALEKQTNQLQQQKLMDEISGLSSPTYWNRDFGRVGDMKPTNLDDAFGSFDPSMLSPLKGLSNSAASTQLQSPTGLQIRQNMNQLRASYPTNLPSSPMRNPSYGFDSSAAVAQAVMNSRSSAFAKQRSQSFIDRGRVAANSPPPMMSSNHLSDWGSPDGKLDWGVQGDELNKLRKSASFGFRNNSPPKTQMMPVNPHEPDVSWVNSLVKDGNPAGVGSFGAERQQQHYSPRNGAARELTPWEKMYIEQEQMA